MAGKVGTVARLLGHLDTWVLIALAGGVGWLLLTGNDTAFLHPRLRPFLMAGVLLLVGFVLSLVAGPRHRQAGWRLAAHGVQAAVLALPLLFLALTLHQGMGAHALARKYTGTEQETLARLLREDQRQPPIADGASTLSLLDIARQMKRLDGKRVVTEGLVYRPAIMPPDYLTLFRFAIFCCAADALPVWLFVESPEVTVFEDEQWVRVDGTLTVVDFNGTPVPVIKADSIEKKAAPPTGAQYLFF